MPIVRFAFALALSSCALPSATESESQAAPPAQAAATPESPAVTHGSESASADRSASPSAPVAPVAPVAAAAPDKSAAVPVQSPIAQTAPAPVAAAPGSTGSPADPDAAAAAPAVTRGERRELTKDELDALRAQKKEQAAEDADHTDAPDPFDVALDAAAARVAQAHTANEAELARGNTKAYVDALEAAAPEAGKDPAQTLALANALFVIAPAESKALRAKAGELAPTASAVLAAEAQLAHREGRWADAAARYADAITRGHRDTQVLRGLRADCLLHTGAFADAVSEWQQCNAIASRTGVETALARIHERRDRVAERGELRTRALAGDLEAVERLLLLDVSWNKNPTNPDYPLSNRAFVKEDLALAEEKLGKDSRRFTELSFLVEGRMGSEPRPADAPPLPDPLAGQNERDPQGMNLPPSPVEKAARKLGFMGSSKSKKTYPQSSVMAPAIYRLLFQDGDIVPTEWVNWFDAEIQSRARSEKGDVEAAVFLLDLYNASIERKFEGWDKLPEKRTELEQYAWGRYKDARIGQRMLERRAAELKPDDPLLKEAQAALPDDPTLARVAYEVARRANAATPELAAARARAALAKEDVTGAIPAMNDLRALLDAKPR